MIQMVRCGGQVNTYYTRLGVFDKSRVKKQDTCRTSHTHSSALPIRSGSTWLGLSVGAVLSGFVRRTRRGVYLEVYYVQ